MMNETPISEVDDSSQNFCLPSPQVEFKEQQNQEEFIMLDYKEESEGEGESFWIQSKETTNNNSNEYGIKQLNQKIKKIAKAPQRRKRKPCHVETKNLSKFFGSRLYQFLIEQLTSQKDIQLLETIQCSTIKSLRSLWMNSQIIRNLSEEYFKSPLPVMAVMESDRICDPSVAMKFIPSFIRGIKEPENFVKLKWDN